MNNRYDTLVDATRNLRKDGFTAQFESDEDRLCDTETGKKYSADELEIIEYHRFEGNTNPSDMSVIYAIEAKDGTRGTMITPFGTYANPDVMEFLDAIRIRPSDN